MYINVCDLFSSRFKSLKENTFASLSRFLRRNMTFVIFFTDTTDKIFFTHIFRVLYTYLTVQGTGKNVKRTENVFHHV